MTEAGPTIDRQSYLGASDIAAVIGLHPYRTALDVWAEKVHGTETRDNPAMTIGRELERPILETLYAKPRNLVLDYPGTLRHPGESWMGATPDALAGREPTALDRAAECKVVGARQMRRWSDPDEGPDGIPPEVLVQVTWQLATLQSIGRKLDSADVTALLGTELRVYGVAWDPDFAADLMEAGRAWWKRHVEDGAMPEVYTDDARRVLAKIHPKPVEGVLAMRDDVRKIGVEYLRASQAEKKAKLDKERYGAELCALIGEASGYEGGGLKVTWLPTKGRVSYKAIVDALGVPESEREEYRGDGTRQLRVTGDIDNEQETT